MNLPVEQAPRFQRLLLATDFSEASQAAFHTALRLSVSLSASLLILHVFEFTDYSAPESGLNSLVQADVFKEPQRMVDLLVAEAKAAGVACTGLVRSGTTVSEILESLSSEVIDLAVIGTRSLKGLRRFAFGSTAESVFRKSNCPILTVGPQVVVQDNPSPPSDGVIVFATDFHVTTSEAISLAAFFCRLMRLPLHCVHVLPRALENPAHEGIVPIVIHEALEHLASGIDVGGEKPVFAVTYGSEISTAILQYARGHRAQLIVLGVRRTSFLTSHLAAHIAFRVITDSPCPVLTMTLPLLEEPAAYTSEVESRRLASA